MASLPMISSLRLRAESSAIAHLPQDCPCRLILPCDLCMPPDPRAACPILPTGAAIARAVRGPEAGRAQGAGSSV